MVVHVEKVADCLAYKKLFFFFFLSLSSSASFLWELQLERYLM